MQIIQLYNNILLQKLNDNTKLSAIPLNRFNNELQQQQAKMRLYHLGKNRYIANGTTTKDKEKSISENVRYEIEKQRQSIDKELTERLNKVKIELYEIDNTIHNIKENEINLFIDGDKLMETINESKSLIAKLNNLSKDVRKKLYNICNYLKKDDKTIDNEILKIAKNNVKKHICVNKHKKEN